TPRGEFVYKKNSGSAYQITPMQANNSNASLLPSSSTNQINEKFYFIDPVRRWTSPKKGIIQVSSTLKKLQNGGDGVGVRIYKEKIIQLMEVFRDTNNNPVKDDKGN